MSKSRRAAFSPETIMPKPLSSFIGETVTLSKMIPLSLTHVGKASIGEFAECIIATLLVKTFKLEFR